MTARGALLAPILAINLLFAIRYLARLNAHTPLLVAAYLLAFAAALVAVHRAPGTVLQRPRAFVLFLTAVTVACIAVFQAIDVHELRVDRWYMIDTFWSNAAAGVYPYTPRPNSNIPGPLPFYYVLALPFQLMGDIGYFALAGLLGYAYLAWRFIGPGRPVYVAVVALLASMAYLWELATRSTLVVNMVVVIAYLYWLEKFASRTGRGQLLAGVMGGLVLSTRTVVALPLLIYGVYAYVRRQRIREGLILAAAACATFILLLLPLYAWDPVGFARYNPLLVQSEFSSGAVTGLALAASALLGWFSGSIRDVIASAGLVLFATVTIALVLVAMRLGYPAVIHGDYFDSSYFNLSLPFLTFALGLSSATQTQA